MRLPKLLSRIPRYKISRRTGTSPPLPSNMTFSVIDRCNMACRTCGIWKNRDTDEMTTEEYEKVVEPLDLFWITVSGGEPFMREDIDEVLDVLVNGTGARYVTVATNGMLDRKTREVMEEVLQRTSDTEFVLNFSIDGPEGRHAHMRRTQDAFKKVADAVDEVKALDSDRISIGSNTVISDYNEDEIEETYSDVMELIDPDSYIVEVAEERDKLYNNDMDFSPENPERALKFVLERLEEKRRDGPARIVKMLRKEFYRYLMSDTEFTNYTGFISAQCNPDGEVWPTSMESRVMGDLRSVNHDFTRLWRSEKAEEVRDYIRKENPQDMLANSFYNNVLCNPSIFLERKIF